MVKKNEYIFGIHSVMSLLKQQPEAVQVLFVQQSRGDKRLQQIIQLAKRQGIAVQWIAKQQLNHWVSGNHQGIAAQCRMRKEMTLEQVLDSLTSPPFLLILDGVQDPHNLGACLRTANGAGVHAVIAPKDKAVGLTPVVRKVASGAAESTPFIQVTNVSRTLTQLKERGIWLFGASDQAKNSLYQTDFTGPIAIALGAEGKGLRRLTRESCDHLVQIPMQGTITSLNVSVAAGVCLYEALRQRTA